MQLEVAFNKLWNMQILDLKFAYSSNGDAFLEHDFITGKETEIKLEDFPTEEELYNRYLASKNYTSMNST